MASPEAPLSTPLAVELPYYLDRTHYAAAGDAVVKLGLPRHHDQVTDAVWNALREEGRHTVATPAVQSARDRELIDWLRSVLIHPRHHANRMQEVAARLEHLSAGTDREAAA